MTSRTSRPSVLGREGVHPPTMVLPLHIRLAKLPEKAYAITKRQLREAALAVMATDLDL